MFNININRFLICFRRVLLDIQSELVEPIIQSDNMTDMLDSPIGEALQHMFENLFILVDSVSSAIEYYTSSILVIV